MIQNRWREIFRFPSLKVFSTVVGRDLHFSGNLLQAKMKKYFQSEYMLDSGVYDGTFPSNLDAAADLESRMAELYDRKTNGDPPRVPNICIMQEMKLQIMFSPL